MPSNHQPRRGSPAGGTREEETRGFAALKARFAQVGEAFALVGGELALVGEELALVGEELALFTSRLAPLGERPAQVGERADFLGRRRLYELATGAGAPKWTETAGHAATLTGEGAKEP